MAGTVAESVSRNATLSPRAGHWVERWWRGEAGALGRTLDVLLAPVELAYGAVIRGIDQAYRNGLRRTEHADVPIVSVGNIAVGGAGKTPVTRWLVGEFLRRGAFPAVLHGGYADDEPALHRQWYESVPVLVGRDRAASARHAVARGASVLILDDGFQHRRLHRDLDIVLVAAETWTERPRLLPRGAWREPPSALARAGLVVVTRKTASAERAREVAASVARYTGGEETVVLHLRPSGWRYVGPGSDSFGTPPVGDVIGVAGIAHPEHFLANARSAGAHVVDALVFRDHHPYDDADLRRIRERAAGRPVVTTEKDAVKLAVLAPDLPLWILEQEVVIEEGGDVLGWALDGLLA